MPHDQQNEDSKLQEDHLAKTSAGELMGVRVVKDEGDAAASATSVSSPSSTVLEPTPVGKPRPGTPSCPQSPQGIPSPPSAMASTPRSQCCEGSGRQEEEGPSPSQDKDATEIWLHELAHAILDKMAPFLLRKYQQKEQVTMEEMLHVMHNDYFEHFPQMFGELCQCMCLCFGIEMREVDGPRHTYELLSVLGLTFHGILDDDIQIVPKGKLLMGILSVIFVKGNRVSEEDLRALLIDMKLLNERQYVMIGDPWKFITEDLVREEYLVYQQVPNSSPARYELLWGPRAQAETSPFKILNHLFSLHGLDLRSYPHLYEQALREEEGLFEAFEGEGV
ncbi:melanoma-associated antigen 8 [Fukomys damarensis]|nr:melanoma-associated antigen 8 [Fukomys damarensis]XP_010602176.1 melanoma-associated antigen 8 [Fukomys damarensis]XP_010602179.1 melanoma-associated antigen 8 [Fukomys damarensis]